MIKKSILSKVIVALTVVFASSLGHGANRILSCTIGEKQGSATIEVIPAEGHPELLLFKIEMKTRLARYRKSQPGGDIAHLNGLLAVQVSPKKNIFASGLIVSSSTAAVLVNSELVTMQGNVNPDGSIALQLLDSDRVLQLGYGVSVLCR